MSEPTKCDECGTPTTETALRELDGRRVCDACWEELVLADAEGDAPADSDAALIRRESQKNKAEYGSEADIRRWTAADRGPATRTVRHGSAPPRGCPKCGSNEPAVRKSKGFGLAGFKRFLLLGPLLFLLTTREVWVCRECGNELGTVS